MKRRSKSRGFTLAEMLVALGVIVLAVSMAVPMLAASRARTRRVDSVNIVRAALASARQSAVERRTTVAVEFVHDPDNPRGGDMMYIVDKSVDGFTDDAQRIIRGPIRLPDFVRFDINSPNWTLENGWDGDSADLADTITFLQGNPPPYPDIAYRADGTAADHEGTTSIALIDTVEDLRTVLQVLPVTGLVIEALHLQDPLLPHDVDTNPLGRGWL